LVLQKQRNSILHLTEINKRLGSFQDLDSLLQHVLLEARQLTNADAGSIYLERNGKLRFEYVQNDSLADILEQSPHILYQNHTLEVSNASIAGHVATTRKALIIEDVYDLPSRVPYTFNPSFDRMTEYRTRSVLTVPLVNSRDRLMGIMQIINPLGPDGKGTVFTMDDEAVVSYFANLAAVAIEKAKLTREIILRMIKMSELRDPTETSSHVNRVGAYSVEIYHRWALDHGVDKMEIQKTRDLLRIAAMLHDVGKIGISDTILKKNCQLTSAEFRRIQLHTVYGARLFKEMSSDWDSMAHEIALTHHERWDGTGYPGKINNIHTPPRQFGPGLAGEEIPLFGRIVALADVYDALMSERSYKSSWDEEEVLDHIRSQQGHHFDPEIVSAFFAIYPLIQAIHKRYGNGASPVI